MDMAMPKYLENVSKEEKEIIMEFRKKGFTWDECERITAYRLGKTSKLIEIN